MSTFDRSRRLLGLASLLSLLGACSSSSGSTSPATSPTTGTQPSSTTLFGKTITGVTLEVDYQTNAAPYVGSFGTYSSLWQILTDNVTRAFMRTPKTLTIPSTLAQMEELTDITDTSFTNDDILAIATAHRSVKNGDGIASFYIVFLDGYYNDGTDEMDVLGVSLGDSGVIGMFKPVIASTDTGLLGMGVAHYVEQSTLVHEFGHAMGLVNNGIPLTSAHQDTAHGAHCTNTKCAMYWSNEGSSSAATFVKTNLVTGTDVIYGAECLADMDALNP